MAAPGETFPAQFALAILQLRQQKQQQDAELSEMRAARADRNFLDKERMDLAAQAQFQDNARANGQLDLQRMQLQANIDTEGKALELKAKIEADRIQKERDAQAIKAFDDFQKVGTAFLPNAHADQITKFTDTFNAETPDGYKVMQIEVPGMGTLLQRVGGPAGQQNILELEKTQAELEQIKQRRALDYANTQLVREKTETEQTKRAKLVGGLSARDAEFARSAFEGYRKLSTNAMIQAKDSGDTSLASKLASDWTSYFDKDPKTKQLISDLQSMMSAYVSSVNAAGGAPPKTDINAIKAAGVEDAYHQVVGQALFGTPEKIVGRVQTGVKGFGGGRTAESAFLVTESGRQIPVTPAQAEAQSLGQPFSQAGEPTPPDPAELSRQLNDAAQVLEDAAAGKIPKNDPRVQRARALILSVK